jgi:hypothetical protein
LLFIFGNSKNGVVEGVMDPKVEKEMERLATAVLEVSEEIELAVEEEGAPEEIEKVKALAADFLLKYDDFLKPLASGEKAEVQRRIGLRVEQLREKLTRLREAPE